MAFGRIYYHCNFKMLEIIDAKEVFMKKAIFIILINICLMGSQCFSDGYNSNAGEIDWDNRVYIDPITGDMIINTGDGYSDSYTTGNTKKKDLEKTKSDIQMTRGENSSLNLETGDTIMDMGDGTYINQSTGAQVLDMGGGNYYNTKTGDHLIEIGEGETINTDTGEHIILAD